MKELQERLIEIEDTLERLRYEVDRPYRSARRYRIFSVILGLFLLTGLVVGLIGTVRIVKEADRIQSLRQSIEEDFETVVRIRDELKTANEMVLKEVWASIPGVLHKVEDDLAARLALLRKDVDATMAGMKDQSDTELEAFTERLQKELDKLDLDIQQIRAIFRDISQAFASAQESNAEILNAREKQLLTLLARELDPDNPELNYQAAESAFRFGGYERAQELAARAAKLRGADPALADQADQLRKAAKDKRVQPASLSHESPGRTRVGPYGIFDLHYFTLKALIDGGYLTVEQAQDVLDQARTSAPAAP